MTQKIAYLDCSSGISGNMFLGAMLDAGLPLDALRQALGALPLAGYELKCEQVIDSGISGTHFDVVLKHERQPLRGFRAIEDLLTHATLAPAVRECAIAIFRILGEAEAAIHGVSLDDVHFHEVGAVDAIVDITGAALAVEMLHITQVYASPLPLTRGWASMAHGLLPLPAPATLEILRKVRAPWLPCPVEAELVTPTGAAILAALARFEMPALTIEEIGYGFGTKRLPWPNCVRLFLGEAYTPGNFQPRHEQHHHEHEYGEHEYHHEHEHEQHHDHSQQEQVIAQA